MRVAKAHAARHGVSLGEAVSTLVKQGADRPLVTVERNGFRVLRLDRGSSKVHGRHRSTISSTNFRENGAARCQHPHRPSCGRPHEHHEGRTPLVPGAARDARWATTALTQLGFRAARLEPRLFRVTPLSPVDAVALLAENLDHPSHEFWKETLDVPAAVAGMEIRAARASAVSPTLTCCRWPGIGKGRVGDVRSRPPHAGERRCRERPGDRPERG